MEKRLSDPLSIKVLDIIKTLEIDDEALLVEHNHGVSFLRTE